MYGIDVSHYQSTTAPGGVTWQALRAAGVTFVMVRATYGTFRDPSAPLHVAAARAVGIQVGLYHFFRPTQTVGEQLAAFNAQALACGIRAGDICPALDIEDDPKVSTVDPLWVPAVEAMLHGLVANFGECMAYITQRDFNRMNSKASAGFILDRPLWVAHYTGAARPATPGNRPYRIWQHRVGPFAPNGAGGAFKPMILDQNCASTPLPVCTRVPGATGSTPPPASGPSPEHSHDELSDIRAQVFAYRQSHDLDALTGLPARSERDTDPAPPPDLFDEAKV